MNWCEDRLEWKHNLRADLHYTFALKKRVFKRFAIFHVKRKTNKVKKQIAEIMFQKYSKKRLLKSTFNHWKNYGSKKQASKLKKAIADQHFESNFKYERIHCYFIRWKLFTSNRKEIGLKMGEAYRYFRMKLISRVFNAFFSYITYRKMRKNRMQRACTFHTNKLKQTMFNKLVFYKQCKSSRRDQINMANEFFKRSILQRSMRSLSNNLNRKIYERERLALFAERKIKKTKKIVLYVWRMYVEYKKIKRQKNLMAKQIYDARSKKKYFRKMKIYRLNRKMKKKYQTMKFNQIKTIFDKRKLIDCLKAWRFFIHKRKIKKEKIRLADENYKNVLKKIYFRLLFHYGYYKKIRRRKVVEFQSILYYRNLRHTFSNWRKFSIEQRTFNLRKIEAQKYYQQSLVRQTFEIILRSAFHDEDNKLDRHLENERRRFNLAKKYLRVWRSRSKNFGRYKRDQCIQTGMKYIKLNIAECDLSSAEENSNGLFCLFSGSKSENFMWDPMCFARPRVPEYMKEKYQIP